VSDDRVLALRPRGGGSIGGGMTGGGGGGGMQVGVGGHRYMSDNISMGSSSIHHGR